MAVGSFSAGLSGLNANAQALSVIGNNLANINTVGYKASIGVVSGPRDQNVGGSSENPTQIGLGVGLAHDLADLQPGHDRELAHGHQRRGAGQRLLRARRRRMVARTRAPATSASTATARSSLRTASTCRAYTTIDPVTKRAHHQRTDQPGSSCRLACCARRCRARSSRPMTNLDAQALRSAARSRRRCRYIDALGAAHVLTMTYTKTGPGAWTYALTADGAEVSGGTAGTPFSLAYWLGDV